MTILFWNVGVWPYCFCPPYAASDLSSCVAPSTVSDVSPEDLGDGLLGEDMLSFRAGAIGQGTGKDVLSL